MTDNYLITGYWGEPHVTAENDRGINAATFGKGRFVLPVGEQFKAEYIGNNTIRMYDGKLIDNGAAAGIPAGEYVDLLVPETGQGMKRNDLIVFQYSKDNATLIESGQFVVIRGTETSGTAQDPELIQADIMTDTAEFEQMPLYRVSVAGAEISSPECVFVTKDGYYIVDTLEQFNDKISELESTMEIRTTKKFVISKTISDDTLPNIIYFVEINKSLTGFSTVTASGVHNGNMCVLQRVLFENTWGEWKLDKPLRLNTGTISSIAAEMLNMFYPVGSIYLSFNNANPQNLFGGTWEQIKDTFLLAAGNTYAAGSTGGSATHTLTVNEMPKHTHNRDVKYNSTAGDTNRVMLSSNTGGDYTSTAGLGWAGGDQPHNNMPPYLAVYMWRRTA